MTEALETDRTVLRPFSMEDAGEAFEWFSDPEVMRFIPGGPDIDLAQTQQRIDRYVEQQKGHGFSKWLVCEKATGQAVGDSGLFFLPDGKRVELGFRFRRSHWGRGYAVEVGRAWIAWFAKHHPSWPLFADVHPEHLRSQRVLEKLGFVLSHRESVWGTEMIICEHRSIMSPILPS